jgi:hypothetical protein
MGEQNMGVKKIIITKSAASLVRSALFVMHIIVKLMNASSA